MASKDTIAVLGAGGTMGLPMARNLAHAGFPVRAWNRTQEKAAPLIQEGAEVLDSPREALEGARIVLTMLADADAVVDSVRMGMGGAAERPELWLQMSTIGEEGTERCRELAREHGLELI